MCFIIRRKGYLKSRTNTPLQALTLMNDETYLEAARKIAERMMKEGGSTESERISHGFTLLPAKYCRDARALRKSLARLLDYSFARMTFAHGNPLTVRAKARLESLLAPPD